MLKLVYGSSVNKRCFYVKIAFCRSGDTTHNLLKMAVNV